MVPWQLQEINLSKFCFFVLKLLKLKLQQQQQQKKMRKLYKQTTNE